MGMQQDDAIEHARAYLKDADGLIITAGAGMGIDSGLPDFRGNEGFWKAYPALGRAKMTFMDIANPEAFQQQPYLAWGFYGHRLDLYRRTQPHAGFEALKKWSRSLTHGCFVVTSNVDGQFQKAGFEANHVLECHGSIHFLQCAAPCSEKTWSAEELVTRIDREAGLWLGALPECMECGGLARPNILMFNDWDWIERSSYLAESYFSAWYKRVKKPVVIELGAGKHIATIRSFGESLKVPLIRVNPHDYDVPDINSVGLSLGALEAIIRLARAE